jgi:hypothetical protein
MRPLPLFCMLTSLSALPWAGQVGATDWIVGSADNGGWQRVVPRGLQVQPLRAKGEEAGVSFAKTGRERRLLAFEAPAECGGNVQSITFPYVLHLKTGSARLAVAAVLSGGDTWFKLAKDRLPSNAAAETGLSLAGMTRAAFSAGEGRDVDWKAVRQFRVGLVIDGLAEGTFSVGPARLSDRPYRATQPRLLESPATRRWQQSADPGARVRLTTPGEGPGSSPCWRFDFSFPGKRHMFAVPSTQLEDVAISAYRALEITYKAELPEGIPGLLLMLIERDGTQYLAEPPPPASGDWKQLSVPFESFKRGAWSKDENDRLDLGGVGSIAVAVHGVAEPASAEGTVWLSRLRLLP